HVYMEAQAGIIGRRIQICTYSVRICKRGKRGHNDYRIQATFDLHNRGLPTARTFELHFRMAAELPIFQQVFRATVNASRLHALKLAPFDSLWDTPGVFSDGRVKSAARVRSPCPDHR